MYALRICGSNDYVSKIDKNDTRCFPPGRVDVVAGINHPYTKKYPTYLGAYRALKLVAKLEGFHCVIENVENNGGYPYPRS